jgi:hypothetical protein
VRVWCAEDKRMYMWGSESSMGLGATHARDAANPAVCSSILLPCLRAPQSFV